MVEPGGAAARRGRRKHGVLTLRDVASLAGVAPITASRALNTPGAVSRDTLARVREAAERIGYVQNRAAGGLASSRQRMIAAILPRAVDPNLLAAFGTLSSVLAGAGYQLVLGAPPTPGPDGEAALLEVLLGRRPDGLVVCGRLSSDAARQRLLASGLPVLETWDLGAPALDMLVGFSHERIGAAVALHLAARGRRCVAAIGAADDCAARRQRAFSQAAAALGLLAPSECEAPFEALPPAATAGQARAGLRALLARRPATDAVFCGSDIVALGVLSEAAAQGIAIPGRLAVIGLGDSDFARHLEPSLTTVRLDSDAVGAEAARLLVARAEGEAIEAGVIDIGFRIVERASG